jgi:hypothetical protein
MDKAGVDDVDIVVYSIGPFFSVIISWNSMTNISPRSFPVLMLGLVLHTISCSCSLSR